MNKPDYTFVHRRFKLNGFTFSKDDLCRIAYSFIKEGQPYEKAVGDFILDWFDPTDVIAIQTSGTTGQPKTIQMQKQAMVNSALATGEFFDLPAGTEALHCLPVHYIAGKMMLVRAFILGWELDFIEPVSNPLERGKKIYDFAAMVPMQAQQSLPELHRIKKLILGGAKVNNELSRQLSTVSNEIFETYGMTETVTHIAAKRIGEEAFIVLPGIEIEEDERHCLVINAPDICNEPVTTNDVVKVISAEQFIWLGRYDNVINSGGVKLFPEQIEEKLAPYFTTRFFVKGIQDDKLGEKLVLVVEGEPYDIKKSVFSKLDKFEKPKQILFVDKFAETPSGKIIRTVNNITA